MIKPAATKVVKPKVTTKQPAVAIKDIGTSYAANSPEVAALSRTKTATATKVLPSKTEPTAAIPTGSQETTYGANVKAVNDLSATARSVTTPNYTQAIKDGLAMPSTPVAQKTAVAAFQPTSAKFQQVAINDEGVISGTPNIERFPTIGNSTDKLHTYTGVTGGVGPLSGKIIQDFTTSKPTVANAEALASTRGGKIVRPPRITKTDKTKTADGSEGEVADGTESPTDGGGENGGENIEGTPTNYAEFIAQQNASAKADYDTLLAEIEKQKQDALHQAEVDKERSMVDAQSSYAQNKATYGANAEALASMGLSGSGYSDYINSSAYAQKVGADQAASSREIFSKQQAESAASQQKLSAQTDYNSFLRSQGEKLFEYNEKQAAKKEEATLTLTDMAASGQYSKEEIEEAAKQQGLTDEEAAKLGDSAYKAKYQANDDAVYADMKTKGFGSDGFKMDDLETLLEMDKISPEMYDKIVEEYRQDREKNYIKDDMFSDIPKDKQKEIYDALMENKYLTDEQKKRITDIYQSRGDSTLKSGICKAYSTVTLNTPANSGLFTNNDTTVTLGGAVTVYDKRVANAEVGQVFIYDNGDGKRAYVKTQDGQLALIRDYGKGGSHEKFMDYYGGSEYDLTQQSSTGNTTEVSADMFRGMSPEDRDKAHNDLKNGGTLSAEDAAKVDQYYTSEKNLTEQKSTVKSGYCAIASTCTINVPSGANCKNNDTTITLSASQGNRKTVDNEKVKHADIGQIFVMNDKVYCKTQDGSLCLVMNYWGTGAYERLYKYYKGSEYDLDK